ncbi:MAG: sigma-70 family RNA polymerase sigma factor [Clostridiales bacterium]|nr:sigma-70 family RNA polymerase sigma factor [Clostridiales bacterium]
MNTPSNDPVSEERLAMSAVSGDERATAALIERMTPTVKMLASGISSPLVEKDDLIQEGLIGLFSAVNTYDASKGASFKTYARTCILNRMITAVRKNLRSSDVPSDFLFSIDEPGLQLTDPDSDPQKIVSDQAEVSRVMETVDKQLSELERKVLNLYLSGSNYVEISERLSITPKSVDNALQRIRKKLKAFK